jgi:hypothetical protein
MAGSTVFTSPTAASVVCWNAIAGLQHFFATKIEEHNGMVQL